MRITRKQFCNICPNRINDKFFINHYLYKENENTLVIKDKINLPVFVILFIPCVIIDFFYCMYDGGIKDFRLPERTVRIDRLYRYDSKYEKFLEFFENNN
jgi:hypothetical protein